MMPPIMRTALYIDDARLQVVLTPETPQERDILKLVNSKKLVEMYRGEFYACIGGWTRHRSVAHYSPPDNDSLIFVLDDPPKET